MTYANIIGMNATGYYTYDSSNGNILARTLTGSTNISVTNGNGQTGDPVISYITATTVSTSGTVNIAPNKHYVSNGAGTITYNLPAAAAVGEIYNLCQSGAGAWTIAQASGQQIIVGNTQTTSGASGSITSTSKGDWIEVMCYVANTTFIANVKQGSVTIV